MAGRELKLVQRSAIGIGPALRKARVARGLSIDEAARDTRIRPEYLDALEEEEFDRLLGDVYVRGCLRSYATYLGLSPDKAVTIYADTVEVPEPSTAGPLPIGPTDPVVGARRRRDNHRLIVMIAITALILAAAFGLLSTRNSTPPPAKPPSKAPLVESATITRGITVAVLAQDRLTVTIRADDGVAKAYKLEPGEGRSFEADRAITVRLSNGGAANVTVNGSRVDSGILGHHWHKTFSFGDEASPSPSA